MRGQSLVSPLDALRTGGSRSIEAGRPDQAGAEGPMNDRTPADRSSWIDLACGAIRVFSDDGTIDMDELDWLLSIAMDDARLDADERRVLGRIFDRVDRSRVSPAVWERIRQLRFALAI
jgi:hypothetical protein